jgi:hypothetical protein
MVVFLSDVTKTASKAEENMKQQSAWKLCAMTVFAALCAGVPAFADVKLVVEGKPNAVIYAVEAKGVAGADDGDGDEEKAEGAATTAKQIAAKKAARGPQGAEDTAKVIADWVEKMSGARLEIVKEMPKSGNVILIGQPAIDAGLTLDEIKSESREGLRVKTQGNQVLIAGQNPTSTLKAGCRMLEQLGCRFLMDHAMGEIYPKTKDVTLKDTDLTEKPGMNYRRIWGSQWSGPNLWKVWNGSGGIGYSHSHGWMGVIPLTEFDTHPEYFSLRDGVRRKGSWYCTSNPEFRKLFIKNYIAKMKESGSKNGTLSPPDGVQYCQCAVCVAQDDPKSIEPSSGRPAMTNRYVDFFNEVARAVAQEIPDATLGFYAYADYTVPPTNGQKLEKNLVVFMAPIRFCRVHEMGSDQCPSRQQLEKDMRKWGELGRTGYRTYNVHLAEITMPFSFLGVWANDIPILADSNTVGFNVETLPAWQLYGPHLYQSIRLAYAPREDSKALMKDYFANFYGPAADVMSNYWYTLDDIREKSHVHTGCFFGMHDFYTPQNVAKLDAMLTEAEGLVKGQGMYEARVQMNREGFKNAQDYLALRESSNKGDVTKAYEQFTALIKRAEDQRAAKYGVSYTLAYLNRFIGNNLAAAHRATRGENKVVAVLPDEMQYKVDRELKGEEMGYANTEFTDKHWQTVKTYSETLVSQGLPEDKTVFWYRTSVESPAKFKGKPELFFVEVDGFSTVYVNGQKVYWTESIEKEDAAPEVKTMTYVDGKVAQVAANKKRAAFSVDVSSAWKPGKNVVVVRCDHSGITELGLGGIIRPIYLIDRVTPAEAPPAKLPAKK